MDHSNFYALIDSLLAERRPDRYTPGSDDEWLDAIADEVAPQIPAWETRKLYAEILVRRRETRATRTTNKILRECIGQPPLDWEFFRGLPLVVGDQRVRIGAAHPQDFLQFAREERDRIATDMATRLKTCEGAERLAALMQQRDWEVGADIWWREKAVSA